MARSRVLLLILASSPLAARATDACAALHTELERLGCDTPRAHPRPSPVLVERDGSFVPLHCTADNTLCYREDDKEGTLTKHETPHEIRAKGVNEGAGKLAEAAVASRRLTTTSSPTLAPTLAPTMIPTPSPTASPVPTTTDITTYKQCVSRSSHPHLAPPPPCAPV